MTPIIIFRVDASLTIGSGHLVRCRNLARVFRDRGFDIIFIYRAHKDSISKQLLCDEFTSFELPPINAHSSYTPQDSSIGYGQWLGCTEYADANDFVSLLRRLNLLL